MYVGMDRFDVRRKIMEDLKAAGLVEKVEDYVNKVGHSERTDAVIEPKLSMQWFVKMESLARPALAAVEEGGGHKLCARQVQKHLPALDDQYQGLVHIASALVGTPHSGMVPSPKEAMWWPKTSRRLSLKPSRRPAMPR